MDDALEMTPLLLMRLFVMWSVIHNIIKNNNRKLIKESKMLIIFLFLLMIVLL